MKLRTAQIFMRAAGDLQDIEARLRKEFDRLVALDDPEDEAITDDIAYMINDVFEVHDEMLHRIADAEELIKQRKGEK